nr:hypothetical protein [Kouleothrix sp.]
MQLVEGFRLAPQQKRLWQLQSAGGAAYCAQGLVAIDGPLDRPALDADGVVLQGSEPADRLRYGKLAAWDADGRILP